MMPFRTPLALVAVGMTLAPLLAGCQPESDDATGGAVPELVVRATDYDYPDAATASAGMTELTIDNQGKELHQIALLRLKDGKSFDDFLAYAKTAKETDPLPSWAVPSGGPAVAAPGQKASAFVPLEEGTYAMICNIPDAKGVPHTQSGMIKPLTVTAGDDAAASVAAPAADEPVKLVDFAFEVPQGIAAGHHVFNVSNDGKQAHEAVLIKLNEGATAQQFADAILTNSGPPPAMPVGGVVGLPVGMAQSFPADLTAGRYAFLCFLPDTATGKPHATLGMMSEFDVQ